MRPLCGRPGTPVTSTCRRFGYPGGGPSSEAAQETAVAGIGRAITTRARTSLHPPSGTTLRLCISRSPRPRRSTPTATTRPAAERGLRARVVHALSAKSGLDTHVAAAWRCGPTPPRGAVARRGRPAQIGVRPATPKAVTPQCRIPNRSGRNRAWTWPGIARPTGPHTRLRRATRERGCSQLAEAPDRIPGRSACDSPLPHRNEGLLSMETSMQAGTARMGAVGKTGERTTWLRC